MCVWNDFKLPKTHFGQCFFVCVFEELRLSRLYFWIPLMNWWFLPTLRKTPLNSGHCRTENLQSCLMCSSTSPVSVASVVVIVVNILQSQSLRADCKAKAKLPGPWRLPDTELWRSKVSPFFVLTKLITGQTVCHFVLAVIKISYQVISPPLRDEDNYESGPMVFVTSLHQIFDSWCHPTISEHIVS